MRYGPTRNRPKHGAFVASWLRSRKSVGRPGRQLRYAADMPGPLPTAAWSLDSLRLPKALENDEKGAAVHAALRARARKLWANGATAVPSASLSEAVAVALEDAQREGHIVRGLEQVEKALEREARGLSMADARSGTERGARVSRRPSMASQKSNPVDDVLMRCPSERCANDTSFAKGSTGRVQASGRPRLRRRTCFGARPPRNERPESTTNPRRSA